MKNIFKKLGFGKNETPSPIPQTLIAELPPEFEFRQSVKSYPKEVLEIHHEFEIASEKLLIEANGIIAEAATKDVEKVNRLEGLGFKQANQVTEIKPLIQKAELSKEQIEFVQYYKRKYPFNKFITENQVKDICHRWNLVCGDVGRFKGFVPEKNLRDIEKSKIEEKDILKIKGSLGYYGTYKDVIEMDGGLNAIRYSGLFKHIDVPQKLQICAPIKDMDISGLELKNGYKLEKKHIPDPVVLQPVKGGYLILTAWGDEASDPNVVNETFN